MQTHPALVHCCPAPHCAPPLHVHAPAVQPVATVALHAVHAPPPVPQFVTEGVSHVVPEQQPVAQLLALHVGAVHLSSVAGLLDWVHVLPEAHVLDVAVHCSQWPKSMFDGLVSHTGVAPVHVVPSSLQEHRADELPVPTVTQSLSVLLQSCCTYQVVAPLVNVPYWNAQMSPISPQLLSPHAAGRA